MTARKPMSVRPDPRALDRLRRAIWKFVWAVLYRPTPAFFFAWRRVLLRLFGAKVGAGAHPYPAARIWAPWNLVMGEASCLANRVNCYSVDRVILGKNVVISEDAYLCAASHDFRDPDFPLITAPIEIKEEVWVAAGAFIGPGVTVGTRAVVGARAVVMRNVDANVIVVGNPAKAIGTNIPAKATNLTRIR
jgi:putative colanic acid biosynthesis acetyltransferase WcaF